MRQRKFGAVGVFSIPGKIGDGLFPVPNYIERILYASFRECPADEKNIVFPIFRQQDHGLVRPEFLDGRSK